jgi:iron complex outermembrane recepter protein
MKRNAPLRQRTLLLLASTAILLPGTAFAQDASADEDGGDTEIIVTAQRKEERLRDVPISITALGSAKLDEANVQSFEDYAKLLPSVSFQSFGPSQSQIFFRGVSSGGDGLHIGPLPTSSMYVDEIPVTTIGGTVDFHIYDISRVEALAGPQGTLFGASSLSGVLRIITNAPKYGVTEGSVDLQLNKWGKGDFGGTAEGMFNFPLGESAALRVVGFYDKAGGYIDNIPGTRRFTLNDGPYTEDANGNPVDGNPATVFDDDNADLVENDYNDVETWGGRAALKIDLDDNWTATTQFIYQNQVANGGFLFDPDKGDLKVTDYLPSRNKDRWWQAALTIQGKLSDWDITYAGGYFQRKTNNLADYSYYSVAYDTYTYEYEGTTYNGYATYFPDVNGNFLNPTQRQVLADKYTKLTQELRISSPSDKAFRLTAGLFLQIQTDRIRADYIVDGLSAAPDPGWFAGSSIFDNDTVFRTRIFRKDRDYAMFAQAEVDLAPNVTLIGGIRGYMANNTIYGFSGFNGGGSIAACIPGTSYPEVPCVSADKKNVESGVIWRGGVRFKPNDDLMFYATASRGFRPGGNNRRPGIIPFKSDTLDNFEAGWKTRLGGNVYFNGAVFYEKWKDVQFGLVPIGFNGITNTYNAGDARIYGIEGDISARFGGLSLSASATYVDAKTTTDLCEVDTTGNIVCTPGVPPAAPSGTRLPVMPKFKGSLTARYETPMAGGTGFLQGSLSHQGGTRSFLLDAEAAAVGGTGAFTTADFSAGVNWDNWRFQAFLQNAFDKRGELSRNTFCATAFCGQYARIYPTQPRQFGIKVGYDF